MSLVVDLLGKDDNCGFESPSVKANDRVEGEPGQVGLVVRTVVDCDVDVARAREAAPLIFGCDGDGDVTGNLRVSAERRIVGLITGAEDADDRVIPAGPETLSVEITNAELIDFTVRSAGKDEYLTVLEGNITGMVGLKLAEDQDGFCSAPTRHAAFKGINLARAKVRYTDATREHNAIVQGTSLSGVRGKYGDNENVLQGEVAINGSRSSIPVARDELAFDREYDPSTFEQSFVCAKNTELAVPLSYECKGSGELPGGGDPTLLPVLAENIGRLSVRGFAQIVSELSTNTACGFESATVKATGVLDGAIGGIGTMTFTSESCAIELPPNTVIDTDCTGVQTLGGGRVIVSAKKIMRGRVTGDIYGEPVLPLTDDAVSIEVTEMRFENFEVIDGEKTIHWNDGVLRGKVTPRLAYDVEDSACSFPTGIARFEDLAYETANVVVTGAEGQFEVVIDSARLQATSGHWGDTENAFGGVISMNGQEYRLPLDPNVGLEPDYDRAAYERSWQCGTLKMPVSYDCDTIDTHLAQAASRTAVLVLGGLAKLVNNDTSCGFESPAVKQGAQTVGTLGDPGGAAIFQLAACRFDWPAVTALAADCNGEAAQVRGSVTVTGTKRLEGWRTGDVNEPIIPTSRDPVVIELELELRDFSISSGSNSSELITRSGRLRGTVRPRVALAIDEDVCSIATPVVTFENVVWENAELTVQNKQQQFNVHVTSSALHAQSGLKDGVENTLTGSILIDGESWSIPVDPADAALDPDYDRGTFDRGYQSCNANLRVIARDEECDLRPQLARATARALVFATGTMAGMIQRDANCGFSDSSVQENPTQVTGDDGDYGSMDFAINNCAIDHVTEQRVSQDCSSRGLYTQGRIVVDAREHVEGELDSIWFTDVIYPRKPNSITMNLDQVSIDELTVHTRDPNTTPLARVIIHSGTLSGVVYPMIGAENDNPDRYSIATPVAAFDNLALTNSEVTLIDARGKRFNVTIASSDISAFNGAYNNDRNRVGGTITVEGLPITLGALQLDEAYNQADFDQRYACTPNLDATLPPNSAVGRPN